MDQATRDYMAATARIAEIEDELESAIDAQTMAEFEIAIWCDDSDRFDMVFGPDDGYIMQPLCGPDQELPF